MKRGCSSPTGYSPAEKEYRKMPSPSPLSYSQVASGTRDSGRVMTDDDLAINEGAMRNTFVVDILRCNGRNFGGNIPREDALKLIFDRALGLDPQEFISAKPQFRGNLSFFFKTKSVFNIDEMLKGKSAFSYTKRVGGQDFVFDCSVRGIREEQVASHSHAGPNYTWVTIENTDFQINCKTITRWLSEFGTLAGELTLEKEDYEVTKEEEERYRGVILGTGNLTVKMQLDHPIPQLLPMAGKRVKIYYKGIQKLCTNCFQPGHQKLRCPNTRKNWLSYVDLFMLSNELPEEVYGKWNDRVEEWRNMFESEHVKNIESLATVMASRQEKNKEKREKIAHLAGILVSQRQQDRHGIPHVHPSMNCPDLSNGVAPLEHTVCTQQLENHLDESQSVGFNNPELSNGVAPREHAVCPQRLENQGKVLDEGQLLGFNNPELSNGVAPLERTVCAQNSEIQSKDESQSNEGTIPMEHNTTPTAEQMLDCLPVEEIAKYLEKKKYKTADEEQTRKQNQSVRTRSMSSKIDSEKKKKTK